MCSGFFCALLLFKVVLLLLDCLVDTMLGNKRLQSLRNDGLMSRLSSQPSSTSFLRMQESMFLALACALNIDPRMREDDWEWLTPKRNNLDRIRLRSNARWEVGSKYAQSIGHKNNDNKIQKVGFYRSGRHVIVLFG